VEKNVIKKAKSLLRSWQGPPVNLPFRIVDGKLLSALQLWTVFAHPVVIQHHDAGNKP
jgi:hypothetical protein